MTFDPAAADKLQQWLDALCEDELAPDDRARLEALLVDSADARAFYVAYMDMHATISWTIAGGSTLAAPTATDSRPLALGLTVSGAPNPYVPPRRNWEHAFPNPLTISIAINALLLVVLSFLVVPSRKPSVVRQPAPEVAAVGEFVWPEQAYIAQLTKTVGCRWREGTATLAERMYLLVGQKLELDAGLAEVTFASGASVILEGPARLELRTPNSAFLHEGKLAALVPTEAVGFTLESETVRVVDLGTEFGVEERKGVPTEVHVYAGAVEAETLLSESRHMVRLAAGQAVRFEGDRMILIPASDRIVRNAPSLQSIKLVNTGVGVKPGESDPRWRIVSSTGDPQFTPRQAVVTRGHGENLSTVSQWISVSGDFPAVPGGAAYKFQYRFNLSGYDPATIRIVARITVDNHLDAMTLNGRPASLPTHRPGVPSLDVILNRGFRAGDNTLEFTVSNRETFMGLRVEFEAFGRPVGPHPVRTRKAPDNLREDN